jgi:hypothetical protein
LYQQMYKKHDTTQDDLVCTFALFASFVMFYYYSLIYHLLSGIELVAIIGIVFAEWSDACEFASNKSLVLCFSVRQSLISPHERPEFARKPSNIFSEPDLIVTHWLRWNSSARCWDGITIFKTFLFIGYPLIY